MAKITPIRPEEEEAVPPKPKKPKVQDAELFRAVSDAIDRRPGNLVPFPTKFHAIARDQSGVRDIIEVSESGECYLVGIARVQQAILRYTQDVVGRAGYSWTARKCLDCAHFWLGYTTPIDADQIAFVRWQGESGLCWRKLPWERRPGLFPTWTSLLRKMTNSDAFCQFIGSLFIEDSYMQQYCFLRGQGGDGKGTIAGWLSKVFGSGYVSQMAPTKNDKFWSSGLVDKRIACLTDNTDHSFLTDGLWMALTGGDEIKVEFKGKQSYTYRNRCKFLVCSQARPRIHAKNAYMRRLIYCELGGDTRHTPEQMMAFPGLLWAEGGAFVDHCMKLYAERCPSMGPIHANFDGQMMSWATVDESRFEALLEMGGFVIRSEALREDLDLWVKPVEFQAFLEKNLGFRQEQLEMLEWLDSKGVHRMTVRLRDGSTGKRYKGLCRAPASM